MFFREAGYRVFIRSFFNDGGDRYGYHKTITTCPEMVNFVYKTNEPVIEYAQSNA